MVNHGHVRVIHYLATSIGCAPSITCFHHNNFKYCGNGMAMAIKQVSDHSQRLLNSIKLLAITNVMVLCWSHIVWLQEMAVLKQ